MSNISSEVEMIPERSSKLSIFFSEVRQIWPLCIIFGFFMLVAVFAPLVAPFDPDFQNLMARLKPPGTLIGGKMYWLGSDQLGRDLLSRVIYGGRISISIAVLSVSVSTVIGSWLGLMAGYYRGVVEIVIMRIVDIVLSIPAILLAIITVAVLGPGLNNLVLVLGLTRWPRYARVAYAQSMGLSKMNYIKSAEFTGVSVNRILWRHIFPNIVAPLLVIATLEFGLMILFEAGLSFLGLGVQPPTSSWGSILSVGRNYIGIAWWIVTLPGICLFLLVLSINMIGDYLRDRIDPRFKKR